ncbi:MAG: hypothetical protein AB1896_11855 [Thermodesulfobacteriota bacterium]
MTEKGLIDALAGVLDLDPVQLNSLARDVGALDPAEARRLVRIILAVPAGDEAQRRKFAFAAVDVLRLAGPEVRALLLDRFEDPAAGSAGLGLSLLRGAVDFISDQSGPGLLEAWVRAGAFLAAADPDAAGEFFLKGNQALRPLSSEEEKTALLHLFRYLPPDRTPEACADLARLAGATAAADRTGRAEVLLALLEQVAPVSWTGALSFLAGLEELLRHLGWERLEAWVQEGLRLARGAGEAGGRRAGLYFSLSSAESRAALDHLGLGQSLGEIQRYLGFYAALHAGRAVTVAPWGALSRRGRSELSGLAATDGHTIYLPERLPFLPDREEGRRLYLVLTAREASRLGYGTFGLNLAAVAGELAGRGFHPPGLEDMPPLERFFHAFPYRRLAREVFHLFETARVESALARDYPGLAGELARWAFFLDPEVPDPDRPVALLLALAQRLLRGKPPPSGVSPAAAGLAKDLAGQARRELCRPGAAVEDSARLTARNYLGLQEVQEGGQEVHLTKLGAKASRSGEEETEDEPGRIGRERLERDVAVYSLFMKPGAREEAASDLSGLLEKARTNMEPRGPEAGPVYTYDEWDQELGGYRLAWVRVREEWPAGAADDFVTRTKAGYARLAARVRRQFELLRPAGLVRKKRQTDGEEPDVDRIIESAAARRAGGELLDDVYIRWRRAARDVAAAVLVDLSGSTARRVTADKTVMDLEKESLVLLAEALETVGDTWGMFGFSGAGREGVVFYTIKDFSGRFDGPARRRLGGLSPGAQNRDGAALRHTAARLAAYRRRRNLLIMLSDAEPDDYDYQGRYAQEDTRTALREIKRQGIHPFCVVVGESGPGHAGHMFSGVEYTYVSRLESLPEKLSLIYRRLTT